MDAVAEGHSYGGPPPTSAFLIVLNIPLAPFLDRFSARGEAGLRSFETLIRTLQDMRADEKRWGREHGVKLEDSHSGHGVLLDASLPAVAYAALMDVDLSCLDQWSTPVQLEWHRELQSWQARLTTVPRRFARRSPLRMRAPDNPRARQVDEAEISDLWRFAGNGNGSPITWQRAQIVLLSTQGSNIASIAQHTVTSAERVRAVIRNFNSDGFASFDPGYDRGERPVATAAEERDARVVAARGPNAYGLPGPVWDARALGDFLVAEGVVEDVDPDWLEALLRSADIDFLHPTVIG
jgi:transposase